MPKRVRTGWLISPSFRFRAACSKALSIWPSWNQPSSPLLTLAVGSSLRVSAALAKSMPATSLARSSAAFFMASGTSASDSALNRMWLALSSTNWALRASYTDFTAASSAAGMPRDAGVSAT